MASTDDRRVGVRTQAGLRDRQVDRDRAMAVRVQGWDQALPAPRSMEGPVHEDEVHA